jgi:carbonic anhydrase
MSQDALDLLPRFVENPGMRKLLQGVIDFHTRVRPGVKDTFARLALGQTPDALFIACSDSRVAANVFASTDPGDLFVVRNVGNMVPPCGRSGLSVADESEAAAIEFAVINLKVRHIIVCGHSECGAMQALVAGTAGPGCQHLNAWLRHGKLALKRVRAGKGDFLAPHLAEHNRVSQLNVLLQLEHLLSYAIVRDRHDAGMLKLHAWWFDIGEAELNVYDHATQRFDTIDENSGPRLLEGL